MSVIGIFRQLSTVPLGRPSPHRPERVAHCALVGRLAGAETKGAGSGHESKVQPSPGSTGEKWTVTGLVTLVVTSFLCVRRIATNQKRGKDAGRGV